MAHRAVAAVAVIRQIDRAVIECPNLIEKQPRSATAAVPVGIPAVEDDFRFAVRAVADDHPARRDRIERHARNPLIPFPKLYTTRATLAAVIMIIPVAARR